MDFTDRYSAGVLDNPQLFINFLFSLYIYSQWKFPNKRLLLTIRVQKNPDCLDPYSSCLLLWSSSQFQDIVLYFFPAKLNERLLVEKWKEKLLFN